jgi:hypothetical protein
MKTPVLFLVAMFTPILLSVTLLLPIYASLLGATYILYIPESGPHPLATHLFDVFFIIESYGKLFNFWSNNISTLSVVEYALPIAGLPILGISLALWSTWRISRKLLDIFHLSASIN